MSLSDKFDIAVMVGYYILALIVIVQSLSGVENLEVIAVIAMATATWCRVKINRQTAQITALETELRTLKERVA